MTVREIEVELCSIHAENMQSIPMLIDMGAKVAGWIAYTGQEMANAKFKHLKAKKEAYHKTMIDLKSKGKEVSPSLVKDYVSTMCADQEAYFLLCDRVNAACTHTLTFINVAISALKEELKAINHG